MVQAQWAPSTQHQRGGRDGRRKHPAGPDDGEVPADRRDHGTSPSADDPGAPAMTAVVTGLTVAPMTQHDWEVVAGFLVAWVVWQGIRVMRWPKKACTRCNGSGGFVATTWWSGTAIRRPCPKCGGVNSWHRRVGSPDD